MSNVLKDTIPNEWKSWISKNINRGVDLHSIFVTLTNAGFSYETIVSELEYEPVLKNRLNKNWQNWVIENRENGVSERLIFETLINNGHSYDSAAEYLQYKPTDLFQNESRISKNVLSRPIGISLQKDSLEGLQYGKVNSEKLSMFYVKQFLKKAECDELIEIIKSASYPSRLTSIDSDISFRTSRTCDLGNFENDIIHQIDDRICRLIGIDADYSESIQGQHYDINQEFKPHTDFFEPHELVDQGKMGQRTHTVMIYLNTVEAGGETVFPNIEESFSPLCGLALIWCNLNEDGTPNYNSLHHAKKVIKGYKAVLTKWFRMNKK